MAIPNVTPLPSIVGAVVIGNGTYPTRFVRSIASAQWLKQQYFARSAGAYSATVVAVYADGTVAGGNSTAKTYLQGLSLKQLMGPRVNVRRAQRLKA